MRISKDLCLGFRARGIDWFLTWIYFRQHILFSVLHKLLWITFVCYRSCAVFKPKFEHSDPRSSWPLPFRYQKRWAMSLCSRGPTRHLKREKKNRNIRKPLRKIRSRWNTDWGYSGCMILLISSTEHYLIIHNRCIGQLTIVLIFQCIPYVYRIVVTAAKDEPTAQRQAAGCKTGIRAGRLESGQLLIGSEIPQSRCLVLGCCYKTLPRGVILEGQRWRIMNWESKQRDES